MFGAPGSPHGLISGRHDIRAVTCRGDAVLREVCASLAASAASVRVVSAWAGLVQARAHGGRHAGHTDRVEQPSSGGEQDQRRASPRSAAAGRVAGQAGTAAISASRCGRQGPDDGVELVLRVLCDRLRSPVGGVRDLLVRRGPTA